MSSGKQRCGRSIVYVGLQLSVVARTVFTLPKQVLRIGVKEKLTMLAVPGLLILAYLQRSRALSAAQRCDSMSISAG